MLKLFCIVVGEGRPFPVDVAADETAGDLKDKIKEKRTNLITCDASDLELYLALKDGAWLSDEDPDVTSLSQPAEGNKVSPLYVNDERKMKTTRKLSKYFSGGQYPAFCDEERIHVLVVVPDEFQPNKKQRQDVGLRELYEFSSMAGLTQLPHVSELAALLLQPLPFQMEITDSILATKIFDQNALWITNRRLEGMINFLSLKCSNAPPPDASENLWQSYYDVFLAMTENLCRGYGFPIEPKRNQVDPSTTKKNLRPDYVLCHNKLLLLRGEEKCSGFPIAIPLKELTDKMHQWNPVFYGELPFILGYATSGASISIVAIDQRLMRHEILTNTSILIDQANVLKFFYNVAFFVEIMANKSNRQGACKFFPYTPITNGIRTMELMDTGFKRIFEIDPETQETTEFDRLLKIYQTLEAINQNSQERTCLQIVSSSSVKSSKFTLLLKPLGMERKPIDSQEVENCLRCILIALKYWHQYGYCHGDIRWSNIVYVQRESAYWMLIDMDESYPNNTKVIDWNHPRTGEKLTFQHDLYQLGKLFSDFTFDFPNVQPAINECLNSLGSTTTAESLLNQFFHS